MKKLAKKTKVVFVPMEYIIQNKLKPDSNRLLNNKKIAEFNLVYKKVIQNFPSNCMKCIECKSI